MKNSVFDKITDRIRWGYLTAFILLLFSYILTFYSTQQVLDQQERVTHTTNVINSLDDLLSETSQAESAIRGYSISKSRNFLEEYSSDIKSIDSTQRVLRFLTSDNNIQQKRLYTLQRFINEKKDLFTSGLIFLKDNNYAISDTLKSLVLQGKIVMDSIKYITSKLQTEESNLYKQRSDKVTRISNFIKVINVASIVIAVVLAFYSISRYSEESQARKEADKQAENLKEQLELQINELNNVNTELVELRSIEKFAATGRISRTIAHEVRNPLTNINLATEHLRSEMQPSSENIVMLDMITRNSNRINELISDLLNSTKAAHLNFVKVNINEMLDSSLEFAQDRLSLKQIKVIKNYATNIFPVIADIEKINIAFLNIIVNAIEAMEPNGVLTIRSENKNERCVVTISDTGKGMDKESLSKLFEPYFTTKEKGNGLGLTNTQNIILSHNAKISAESIEGKGSSFIISFSYA